MPEVEVDVWHSSPVSLYENQDPNQADMNLRGRLRTRQDGVFQFRSDPHIDNDVVFGVTRMLMGDYRRHDDGEPPARERRAPKGLRRTTGS